MRFSGIPLDKPAAVYYNKIEKELTKQAVCSHIVKLKNNRHKFGSKGRLFFLITMIIVFMIVIDVCSKCCCFQEKTPQFQQIAKSDNTIHHDNHLPSVQDERNGSEEKTIPARRPAEMATADSPKDSEPPIRE